MPQFTNRPGTGAVDHCNGALGQRLRDRCKHQDDCITAHGIRLLEAFKEANPGVRFTEDNNPCLTIIGPGRARAHYSCDKRYIGGIIDHEGAVRIGKGQPVYIPQPYLTAHNGRLDGENAAARLVDSITKGSRCLRRYLSGMTLTIRYAGSGRSWYYPGNSALWVVGDPEAVESMNFDYEVPEPPPTMSERGEERKPTDMEKFDAPSPLPAWEVRLPEWTCQHVSIRGRVCGKVSVESEWPPSLEGLIFEWPDKPTPELDRELCRDHRQREIRDLIGRTWEAEMKKDVEKAMAERLKRRLNRD